MRNPSRCVLCGAQVTLLKKLTAASFCCDEHRTEYHSHLDRVILARLHGERTRMLGNGSMAPSGLAACVTLDLNPIAPGAIRDSLSSAITLALRIPTLSIPEANGSLGNEGYLYIDPIRARKQLPAREANAVPAGAKKMRRLDPQVRETASAKPPIPQHSAIPLTYTLGESAWRKPVIRPYAPQSLEGAGIDSVGFPVASSYGTVPTLKLRGVPEASEYFLLEPKASTPGLIATSYACSPEAAAIASLYPVGSFAVAASFAIPDGARVNKPVRAIAPEGLLIDCAPSCFGNIEETLGACASAAIENASEQVLTRRGVGHQCCVSASAELLQLASVPAADSRVAVTGHPGEAVAFLRSAALPNTPAISMQAGLGDTPAIPFKVRALTAGMESLDAIEPLTCGGEDVLPPAVAIPTPSLGAAAGLNALAVAPVPPPKVTGMLDVVPENLGEWGVATPQLPVSEHHVTLVPSIPWDAVVLVCDTARKDVPASEVLPYWPQAVPSQHAFAPTATSRNARPRLFGMVGPRPIVPKPRKTHLGLLAFRLRPLIPALRTKLIDYAKTVRVVEQIAETSTGNAWQRMPAAWKRISLGVPVMAIALAVYLSTGRSDLSQVRAAGTQQQESHESGSIFGGMFTGVKHDLASRAAVELTDTFLDGLGNWSGSNGWEKYWKSTPGAVVPSDLAIFTPSIPLHDYVVEFAGQVEKKALSFVVRARDTDNYCAVRFVVTKPGILPEVAVERYSVIAGEKSQTVRTPLHLTLDKDAVYHVRVEVTGANFAVFLQDRVADSWTDDRFPSGGFGLFAAKGEVAQVTALRITHQTDTVGKFLATISK